VREVNHWHRLPREVVDAPSLETVKAMLDGALSNLIQLKMSLLTAGGVGLDGLKRSLPTQTTLQFFDCNLFLPITQHSILNVSEVEVSLIVEVLKILCFISLSDSDPSLT